MSFKFGKSSIDELNTCHNDLQLIMNVAIEITSVDFGISEGYRSVKMQKEYFDRGLSKIDGITKKGKHNVYPSIAVDIYPFIEGKAKWDNEHLSYLSGIIHAVSEILYAQGKIEHKVRWGGNWDMDGVLLLDQSFDDRPHFELYKPVK